MSACMPASVGTRSSSMAAGGDYSALASCRHRICAAIGSVLHRLHALDDEVRMTTDTFTLLDPSCPPVLIMLRFLCSHRSSRNHTRGASSPWQVVLWPDILSLPAAGDLLPVYITPGKKARYRLHNTLCRRVHITSVRGRRCGACRILASRCLRLLGFGYELVSVLLSYERIPKRHL